MDMETRAVFDASFEIRQEGKRPVITGRFPYGSLGVVADRGSVRKETFEPGAFAYAIQDETRQIHFLSGHSYDKPLASRRAGTLTIQDTPAAVEFEAVLPVAGEQPSWVQDFLLQHRGRGSGRD